jgi:glycosyltransferase involved in cell wall biosynthesis
LDDPRLILCLFSALISIVVTVQVIGVVRRMSWRPPPLVGPVPGARLSVIIPARDEEADIGQALRSVLNQVGVELEVIVVNDHSSDRTGEIADMLARSDPRLEVIHNPELPPGWLGKCNAMQQASARASGDFLLFSDADIMHEPTCFATALLEMDRHDLDFLSLFPLMHCVSLWENAILPALVGGMAILATPGINDPESPDALAAGAFMMVRTSVFQALGGFERIRGEMCDDVALAKLIKHNGYRYGFHAATELLQVRIYKGNSHAFWGMTKNILQGLDGRLWLAPAVMFLPAYVFWIPIVCIVAGISEGSLLLVSAGSATYMIHYGAIWSGRKLFKFHWAKALLFPLVAIPAICCMAKALYLYSLRGEVLWRGRSVQVRGIPRN